MQGLGEGGSQLLGRHGSRKDGSRPAQRPTPGSSSCRLLLHFAFFMPLPDDSLFMRRALDLAALGRGYARPNPLVGCVVVAPEGNILGEGYHQQYGGPHAEVNALASVADQELLRQSRVFVTLEPCAHHGKTPPCADLLIAKGVPEVIVCNDDPTRWWPARAWLGCAPPASGSSTGLLAEAGRQLNRRFFTFQEKSGPTWY
ncbi:MAG: bifunctional diaminohydroxyphosphoribosylaminopyrimidine deaminase/5-amino-6-(5-phosphoribosylamino)uracil reductase RibD [Hymenobacter sp.]